MFFFRAMVSAHCPVYYSQSIGYASGFYGVTYSAIVLGARITLQIYTGQLMSSSNKNRINLFLRQSVLFCLAVLVFFTIPMMFT